MAEDPSLTLEQLRHIARLARMQMHDDELLRLQPHLVEMIELFGRLRMVSTEGLEPTVHASPLRSVWREDTPSPGLGREVLEAALESRDGLFLVPSILAEAEP